MTFGCSFEGRNISCENCKRLHKRETINSLLKKAQKGRLILRSPEGQEFILAEIRDFSREIELTRQNKALMRLLDARGKQTKTVKTAGLKKQLGLD